MESKTFRTVTTPVFHSSQAKGASTKVFLVPLSFSGFWLQTEHFTRGFLLFHKKLKSIFPACSATNRGKTRRSSGRWWQVIWTSAPPSPSLARLTSSRASSRLEQPPCPWSCSRSSLSGGLDRTRPLANQLDFTSTPYGVIALHWLAPQNAEMQALINPPSRRSGYFPIFDESWRGHWQEGARTNLAYFCKPDGAYIPWRSGDLSPGQSDSTLIPSVAIIVPSQQRSNFLTIQPLVHLVFIHWLQAMAYKD